MFMTRRVMPALVALSVAGLSACSGSDPGVAGEAGTVNVRRITESQYRHTVADIFGPDIPVNGRFEPDQRDQGLLAIGSARLSISPAGFEQYYSMASGIAEASLKQDVAIRKAAAEKVAEAPKEATKQEAKVAETTPGAAAAAPPARAASGDDGPRRATPPKMKVELPANPLVTCEPADPGHADDACVRQTVERVGRVLFRRPLSEEEIAPRVAVAKDVAEKNQDFNAGMKQALVSLLVAPEFLFRVETAEAVPGQVGKVRLDAYSKAARLSYALWDAAPDDELLKAAETGELHKDAGVKKQIKRLLDSPRVEAGTRAFFDDMLQNDLFATITKDATIYPKFSLAVAESSREQTLRTLVDQLVTKKQDYRKIFTSRDTFIDRNLASVYKVAYLGDGGWVPYTFPEDSEHAGVLTHASFLSLFSHPGRSSPTKRGVAVNEVYLCEQTPLPPANVDFSIVNNDKNPDLPTVRQRLMAHALDDSCSGCHTKSDPVGLSLERFDSLGQERMDENGKPIDVSAELAGHKFEGAKGLGEVIAKDPRAPACLVRNVYAYAVGHAPAQAEQKFLDAQAKQFAGDNYVYPKLLERIASSKEFFAFSPAASAQPGQAAAAASTNAKTNGGSP